MRKFVFFFFTIIFFPLALNAHNEFQPKIPQHLVVGTTQDKGFPIQGARVVYANYNRLKENYPILESKSDKDIDTFIIENFAFMSENQEQLKGITTEIPIKKINDKNESLARPMWAPPTYDRSRDMEVPGGGMINLKGVGHVKNDKFEMTVEEIDKINKIKEPEEKKRAIDKLRNGAYYRSGVATLGEIVCETIAQISAQKALDHFNAEHPSEPKHETVESLFIIDVPADLIRGDGNHDRLAIYGREAHITRKRGETSDPKSVGIYNPPPKNIKINSELDKQKNFQQTVLDGFTSIDFGAVLTLGASSHEYKKSEPLSWEDIINTNKYVDSHDSRIFSECYDKAKASIQGGDSEEAKKLITEFINSQTNNLNQIKLKIIPSADEKALNFTRKLQADLKILFLKFRDNKVPYIVEDSDFEELISKIGLIFSNKEYIENQSPDKKDISARNFYSMSYHILSMMNAEQANKFIVLLKSKNAIDDFLSYLRLSSYVIATDTQGYPNDLPRLKSLYDAMVKNNIGETPKRKSFLDIIKISEIRRDSLAFNDENNIKFVNKLFDSLPFSIKSLKELFTNPFYYKPFSEEKIFSKLFNNSEFLSKAVQKFYIFNSSFQKLIIKTLSNSKPNYKIFEQIWNVIRSGKNTDYKDTELVELVDYLRQATGVLDLDEIGLGAHKNSLSLDDFFQNIYKYCIHKYINDDHNCRLSIENKNSKSIEEMLNIINNDITEQSMNELLKKIITIQKLVSNPENNKLKIEINEIKKILPGVFRSSEIMTILNKIDTIINTLDKSNNGADDKAAVLKTLNSNITTAQIIITEVLTHAKEVTKSDLYQSAINASQYCADLKKGIEGDRANPKKGIEGDRANRFNF